MTLKANLLFAGVCAAGLAAVAGAQAEPPYGASTAARATLYELPNYQGRSITIYRSNDNLGNTDFNDRAQSAHFDGDWTVCTDSNFRGNCQTVSGDVPNLSRYGLANQLSSLQQASSGGYGDNGQDRGYGDRGGDRGSGQGGDRGYPTTQDDRGYPGAGGGGSYQGGGDRGYPGGNDRGYGGQGGYGDNRDLGANGAWASAGGVRGRSVVFFARPQNNGQDIAAWDRTAADWFCRQQGLGAAVYYDTSYRSNRGWRFNNGAFSVNSPVLRDVVCRKQ
jgi:hypothetical protein